MLPLAWFMVLLHSWVGPSLYVIPKWVLRELEGSQQLLPLLEVNTLNWCKQSQLAPIYPKGRPLGAHMIG